MTLKIKYYTLIILPMCSAPLQVRLHPLKSTALMLAEYLTLWQMTKTYRNIENTQLHR